MSDDGARDAAPARAWTLEAARAMLVDVRERTERAVAEVDRLLAERAEARDRAARERAHAAIESRVSRWVREMEALGAEVDGAWHVDFRSGAGCFCWRWPEPELSHFHGSDEGAGARTRIQ